MIKDSALQFLASIYQSNLSHLCSTATLCSRKGTQLMPTLGPRCTQARGLCNNFHPFLMTKQPTQKKTLHDWRWALPTHGKSSKQGPAPWINEKVSLSITLWSTEQTLIIHTNHGDYHQYQKLPDTSICSTWKILCGQGDTHIKDVTSLPSISTPCSSAKAADPAQRPNFPKAQASDPMGKLNPACKSTLQYWGSEVRHAQDTWDRLSHSQQVLSNSGQTSWAQTIPKAKLLPAQPSLRAAVLLQSQALRLPRHWTHETPCTAYCTSGWEMWNPGPGARHAMPRSSQAGWGVSEGAAEEPLQHPGAQPHCLGHQQREAW